MARAPTGYSWLASSERWRAGENVCASLAAALGAAPSPEVIKAVEAAGNEYLHTHRMLADGSDLQAARDELVKLRSALSVVVEFFDDGDGDVEPSEVQRRRQAALMLMRGGLSFDGLPPAPGPMLVRLAEAFRAAAGEASGVKLPSGRDPAQTALFIATAHEVERSGRKVTVRGDQAATDAAAEPWSPYVEFAFCMHSELAALAGLDRSSLPQRNSGYPRAIREALKSREKK